MNLFNRIKNKIQQNFLKPVEVPSYEIKRATLKDYKEKYGLNV
jgi:hypothetical protein